LIAKLANRYAEWTLTSLRLVGDNRVDEFDERSGDPCATRTGVDLEKSLQGRHAIAPCGACWLVADLG